MNKEYAEVVVNVKTRSLDRVFHYRVPESMQADIATGSRVRVPFGRRKVLGFVIGFVDFPDVEEVKDIEALLDSEPVFTSELLEVAEFLQNRYLCSVHEALACIAPAGKPPSRRIPRFAVTCELRDPELLKGAPVQQEVYRLLFERGPLRQTEITEVLGCTAGPIRALLDKGLIKRVYNIPPGKRKKIFPAYELTAAQKEALSELTRSIDGRPGRRFLLWGVTGSGKTELYLQAATRCVNQGRQVLILVPEIALTPQMTRWFSARFPGNLVVLHSKISRTKRYDAWIKIRRGEIGVVLGARSAVFAPFLDLGLVVVDEEHENTYKQEEAPPYDAREVALFRAREFGATVVFGSATPSLETLHRVRTGNFELLKLPHRIDNRPLPQAEIVDMRREIAQGNRSLFSRLLRQALSECFRAGHQAILFLNRRGHASFLLCRNCGQVIKCPHCEVSLTYHRKKRALVCHYCGYRTRVTTTCPECGSEYLKPFGIGTERVEAEFMRVFPEHQIIRMDRDTTSRKDSFAEIIEAFRKKQVDVLVGTQMVAKGLDIPNVTVVGVISADTSLHLPDFRAGERTFQLLTQVSGRAGRGVHSGRVIVQTYSPNHYSILGAKDHNYREFYSREFGLRKELGYPPYTHLVQLLVEDTKEERAKECATWLVELLPSMAPRDVDILGPADPVLKKLKDQYRVQIIIRGQEIDPLLLLAKKILSFKDAERRYAATYLRVSVDPVSLL